jgi:cytochrome oxidase Cu insertion factor (SCO1/SenC/PrrC family)
LPAVLRYSQDIHAIAGGFMKALFRLSACAAAAAVLWAQNITPPKTTLKVGDEAPDFSLPDTNNKQVKLSDFRGKKAVVLAFFPAAFSPG